MTSFSYEKIIDLGFWKSKTLHYYSPRLNLIMDIWKFKITEYEVRASVYFQKMLGRRGVQVFEKVRPGEYICIYLVWYLISTPMEKQIPTPHWYLPIVHFQKLHKAYKSLWKYWCVNFHAHFKYSSQGITQIYGGGCDSNFQHVHTCTLPPWTCTKTWCLEGTNCENVAKDRCCEQKKYFYIVFLPLWLAMY